MSGRSGPSLASSLPAIPGLRDTGAPARRATSGPLPGGTVSGHPPETPPEPHQETIAAIATAAGQGAIGIVRVSGPRVPAIAEALLGRLPAARKAILAVFRDRKGEALDQGLALFFPAPHSFTGEAVLELQGHGGPAVLRAVLQAVLDAGARPARPGEFSERAFLNGRIDLAQAEAIADLIASHSQAGAQAAVRSLQGEFSRRVHTLIEELTAVRVQVEGALDFPEEEIDPLNERDLHARTRGLLERVQALLAGAVQGRALRDGLSVVLVGPPNAGKSSLLNALSGEDRAIVSERPGTTRDVLREQIHLEGMPLHLLDTAGLRDTADAIEQEGVRRARAAIGQADLVLLLADDADTDEARLAALLAGLPEGVPRLLLRNKIDLTGRPPGLIPAETPGLPTTLALSIRTGQGLDDLRAELLRRAGLHPGLEGLFSARRRHVTALEGAEGHLAAAAGLIGNGQGELAADELHAAQRMLGEITGEVSSDDLLGRIFSEFCIGK